VGIILGIMFQYYFVYGHISLYRQQGVRREKRLFRRVFAYQFVIFDKAYFCVTNAQRFALPALGRAAGRRPTGKMLRRRKMLGIAPESPASGARFVGRF